MIERTCLKSSRLGQALSPPAYPHNAAEVFREPRVRLSQPVGTLMPFARLAQILGRSKSTTHHWFGIHEHPQLIGFLCLLERFDFSARLAFIDTYCREYPTLEHPWLDSTAPQVQALKTIIKRGNGITVVAANKDDRASTFLVTALGHARRSASHRKDDPLGIDAHRPDWFVPVESLSYVDVSTSEAEIRNFALRMLPRILTTSGKLIVLSGVDAFVKEFRNDLLRCSARNHLLVTLMEPSSVFGSRLPGEGRIEVIAPYVTERRTPRLQLSVHSL